MHLINLKAAWEATDADSRSPGVRVALPLEWAAISWPGGRPPVLARLARRFGRPPHDGPASTFRLRLAGFAGLAAIELNGSPASWREEGDALVVGPVDLLPRNVLIVWVDASRASAAPGPWGVEALLECG